MAAIFRLVCVISIVLLAACAVDSDDSPPETAAFEAGHCADCKRLFSINKLSLTHVDGSEVLLRLSADKVVGRPRKGRMVTFDDYDELYLMHLLIDQPLKGEVVKLDVQSLAKVFSGFDDGTPDRHEESANESPDGIESDTSKHRLNRLLIDDIRITIKPIQQAPVVLTAGHAEMLVDTTLAKFEQNVRLKAAKCGLAAPTAIWSSEHNGLFLPQTYRFNGKTQRPGGFYQITPQGRCVRIRPAPAVEYVDMLETVENRLFESIPLPMRLLFGLAGPATPP